MHIKFYFDRYNSYNEPLSNCEIKKHRLERIDEVLIFELKPTLSEFLKYNNIDVSCHPIEQYQEFEDTNAWYLYESYRTNFDYDFFKDISKTALNYIKSSKMKLLLWIYDAMPMGQNDYYRFKSLYNYLEKYNIPVKNVFVLSPDINFNDNYLRWSKKNKIKKNFNYSNMPFWDAMLRYEMNNRWLDQSIKNKEYITSVFEKNREKNFLCLNGRNTNYRFFLMSELTRRKLIKNSYTSMVDRYNQGSSNIQQLLSDPKSGIFRSNIFIIDNHELIECHLEKFINTFKPITLDIDRHKLEKDDRQYQKHFYTNSYFSLVTETFFKTDPMLFVTEKTFKPIINLHPFIVLGNTGILQYLRNEGYETFPELFNESYDYMDDHTLRMKHILYEVERFCSLSPTNKTNLLLKIKDKLYHNQKLFFDRNYKERYNFVFNTLVEGHF